MTETEIAQLEQRGNLLFKSGANDATGHVCTCGRRHKWGSYVFAHWDFKLIHTCECGRESQIRKGSVKLKEKHG